MIAAADLLPVSMGRTWHVSRDGSDGFSGEAGKPWKTLPWAMRHVEPGDIVRIDAGEREKPAEYPEPWPAGAIWGTPEDTITYAPRDPARSPVIKTFPYWRAGCCYHRYHGLTWNGLGITNPPGDAALVFGATTADGPCHHIEVSNYVLEDFTNPGRHAHGFLRKEGAHHTYLLDGVVRRIGAGPQPRERSFHQHALYCGAGHDLVVAGMLVEDIYAGYGLHWWGAGADDYVVYVTIRRTFAPGITVGAPSPIDGPSRVCVERARLEDTALGTGVAQITNYRARGRDVRFDLISGAGKPLFDTRLNGSTPDGAGLYSLAGDELVGHQAFVMPDVLTRPDPCAGLAEALAAAHEQLTRVEAENKATAASLARIRAGMQALLAEGDPA